MIQKIKIIKTFIIILSLSFPFSANAQTVEEIIKGRKAMFSENYQNGKKISILLKSNKIEAVSYTHLTLPTILLV